ncbi:MAG: hypothetical protein ACRD1I_04315 [Terriglobia bacterium]
MADQDPKIFNQEPSQTLADNQIVTERKLPRRSFLAATGAFLAGAAVVVSGVRAAAQEASDPDKKKGDSDKSDKKKGSDPDKKRKKGSDPDKKKASDPDK